MVAVVQLRCRGCDDPQSRDSLPLVACTHLTPKADWSSLVTVVVYQTWCTESVIKYQTWCTESVIKYQQCVKYHDKIQFYEIRV